jgi:hypothetical protein
MRERTVSTVSLVGYFKERYRSPSAVSESDRSTRRSLTRVIHTLFGMAAIEHERFLENEAVAAMTLDLSIPGLELRT